MSLTEAMMATVILGMAAAGVLLPFASGAIVRAAGMRRTLVAQLANNLMEEIISCPFEDIITTWDGWTDNAGQVKRMDGTIFTDGKYADLSREVQCNYVYVPQESGAAEAVFVRVTVRVFHRNNEIAVIHRLIGK